MEDIKHYKRTKLFSTSYLVVDHIFDIHGIKISIWKQHDFEAILNSNHVMKIQDAIGKLFVYRETSYYVCVCVCVFSGLQTERYDRIMRWWSSNLGQVLLNS